MDQMPPDMQPAMGAEAEAPAAEGKTVCIEAAADGSFSVYMKGDEPMEPMEGMEAMGPGAEAPEGQPAASIDEALEMARQMLQDDGRSPEEAAMSGYNKGKPAARPSPAQVFGGM